MIHNLSYYRTIQGATGSSSAKETQIRQRKAELDHYFEFSQDCEDVEINGVDQSVAITKSTDPAIKHIVSKPDESIYLGDIVNWSNVDWIVDTIDADTRINSSGKIRRCNTEMIWLDENGVKRTYPGFCEDANKNSEGITDEQMISVGDGKFKVKIHLDEHSAKINRDKRFLLDASLYLAQIEATGAHPSAYIVTRRNVLTGNCDGHGYIELTIVETAYSENDNTSLMIADYYNADDIYVLTISNSDGNLTVAKNATYTLSCSATKNGTSLNQSSILFQTSDASVATISSAGKITGVANGSCTITVKSGNARRDIALTIETASATASIKIFVDDTTIVYGQSKRVNFAAYQNGVEVSTTLVATLSCASTVAAISTTGTGYVVITAVDNKALIGTMITFTVSSTALGISATHILEIGGWF